MFLGWVLAGCLVIPAALVVAYLVLCFVTGLYNLFKYGLMAIYDDWMDARHAMQRDRLALAGDTKPRSRGPKQPTVAEAIAHVQRSPHMDGLSTGTDDTVVTRFNRR